MNKNESESNLKKIAESLFWSFGERILAQLVSTIVTIILARLLTPEHYGIISIVTVFITVCNVFVTSGFGSAIVQKKEVEEEDYNTAFWLSLFISIALYVLLFIGSPYIAEFYDMPELKWVVRVMAIRLPVAAINTIQQARMRREMEFKKFFVATLFGTIISGIVGIWMAVKGFGVWALVFQYLTNTSIDTMVLCIIGRWNPKLQYSRQKAREIFSFGWKVLASDLIANLETDIRSLIVGKIFGPSELAYYDQGKKYPALLVNNINASINKVMLPAYAKQQDNLSELKNMLRRSIQIAMYTLVPVLIGFGVVADNFISAILTDKWISCVPFIQIFCIIYLLRPLEIACHQAILAIGKSDTALKIMIAINVTAVLSVFIAVFIFKSVLLVAIGSLISTAVSIFLFMIASKNYLNYSFMEQLGDISSSLCIGVLMGVVVWIVGRLNLNTWVLILIQIIVGVVTYLGLSVVFKNQTFLYLLNILKKMKF